MGLAINYPKNQWMYIDSNGNFKPAAGYKLHVYEANTTTEQSAYTEVTATTPHNNPITLDSEGKASIYLDVTKPSYKFVLKDPTDTTEIETIDYVNYNQPPALTAPSTSPYLTASSSSALSAERTLAVGSSLLKTDNGANSTLQLDAQAPVLQKTGAYEVTTSDRGKVVYYTGSGGVALTFPASATLTDGFFINVSNRSSGNITLTPDGSETIDGSSTLVLTPDQGVNLFCNGSNLYTLQPSISGQLNSNLNTNTFSLVSDAAVDMPLTPGAGGYINATRLKAITNVDMNGQNLVFDTSTGIIDENDNEQVTFTTVSSAVNNFNFTNSITATDPILSAVGGDTNIGHNYQAKGTGTYNFLGTSTASAELRLYENTANGSNYTGFKAANSTTSSTTYILPASAPATQGALNSDSSGNLSWGRPGLTIYSTDTEASGTLGVATKDIDISSVDWAAAPFLGLRFFGQLQTAGSTAPTININFEHGASTIDGTTYIDIYDGTTYSRSTSSSGDVTSPALADNGSLNFDLTLLPTFINESAGSEYPYTYNLTGSISYINGSTNRVIGKVFGILGFQNGIELDNIEITTSSGNIGTLHCQVVTI
jgi:hypothetical protein